MNYQVRIIRRSNNEVLWVDGGYRTAAEAEKAGERQLAGAGRDPEDYHISVEPVS